MSDTRPRVRLVRAVRPGQYFLRAQALPQNCTKSRAFSGGPTIRGPLVFVFDNQFWGAFHSEFV